MNDALTSSPAVRRLLRLIPAIGVAAGLSIAAALPAQAAVVLSTGFESDDYYRLGSLRFQNSWFGGSNENTFVQDQFTRGGTQAVRVDGLASSGTTLHMLDYDAATHADQGIRASIDFRFESGNNTILWQPLSLGTLGFSVMSSGLVCAGSTCDDSIAARVWHQLMIELDYTHLVSRFYIDGDLIASQSLAGRSTRVFDVSFGSGGGTVYSGTPNAYLDNLHIETFAPLAVPEPPALLLAAAALLALFAGRRRGTDTPSFAQRLQGWRWTTQAGRQPSPVPCWTRWRAWARRAPGSPARWW